MWAVRLSIDQIAALAMLRTIPGIEAGEEPSGIWLRGAELSERLELLLAALPLAERFDVSPESMIRPLGRLLPTGRLPDIEWRPIARFVEPLPPVAALAGRMVARCPLGLVRSSAERPANVLVLRISDLSAYAAGAAHVRLHGCRFALNAEGLAVVCGSPLPPLAGEQFAETNGVAVPCGWTLAPPVSAVIVAEALRLAPGDLALFNADGGYERIAAEQFVKLTRSAARMSQERLHRA